MSAAFFRVGRLLSAAAAATADDDAKAAGIVGELALSGTADTAKVNAMLDKLAGSADDLRVPFTRIDARLSQLFRQQFESAGRTFGTPWAPLRTTTVSLRTRTVRKRKRLADGTMGTTVATTNRRGQARAGFATILRNTDTLFGSLAKGSSAAAVRVIGPREYARGTLVPYARFHQSGFRLTFFGRPTSRTVAPRPLFPSAAPPVVVAMVEDEVGKVMGGA